MIVLLFAYADPAIIVTLYVLLFTTTVLGIVIAPLLTPATPVFAGLIDTVFAVSSTIVQVHLPDLSVYVAADAFPDILKIQIPQQRTAATARISFLNLILLLILLALLMVFFY